MIYINFGGTIMSKNFDIKILDELKEKDNVKKHFYIETWGCQMNEEDSEKLSGMLKRVGYTKTENKEDAGIILFNTCCVRENAEDKLFGKLGEVKKIIEKIKKLLLRLKQENTVHYVNGPETLPPPEVR